MKFSGAVGEHAAARETHAILQEPNDAIAPYDLSAFFRRVAICRNANNSSAGERSFHQSNTNERG